MVVLFQTQVISDLTGTNFNKSLHSSDVQLLQVNVTPPSESLDLRRVMQEFSILPSFVWVSCSVYARKGTVYGKWCMGSTLPVVESPSLEILNSKLDKLLAGMV